MIPASAETTTATPDGIHASGEMIPASVEMIAAIPDRILASVEMVAASGETIAASKFNKFLRYFKNPCGIKTTRIFYPHKKTI
jgi:hypothetical protein